MKPNEWLEWICSSKNQDELGQNYDQWAETYEADINDVWKNVPRTAAVMLTKFIPNKVDWILDVGAGTGMVGLALAELGFKQISGMDISASMLTQAKKKGVYQTLVCCSILDPKFETLPQPIGVIATGVFAERHAGEEDLRQIQSKIRPGGIFIFTARESFLAQLQSVLEQPEWSCLDKKMMGIYDDPMYIFAYRLQK